MSLLKYPALLSALSEYAGIMRPCQIISNIPILFANYMADIEETRNALREKVK